MKNIYLILNADGSVLTSVDNLAEAFYVVISNGVDGSIIDADGVVLYMCSRSEKSFNIPEPDGSFGYAFSTNSRRADGKVN